MLDGVRDDRADDRKFDRRPCESRGAVHAQRLGQRLAAGGQREAQSNRDVPHRPAALELEGSTGAAQGPAGMGNDEAAQGVAQIRAGRIRHDGRLTKGRDCNLMRAATRARETTVTATANL